MKKEVNVCVDQAGHQRCVAEVDNLHSSGMSNGCSGSGDSFAFDKDFTGADNFAVGDVEHSRCVKNNRMFWRSLSRETQRSKGESERAGEGLHGA
jgi:hypothetical protein